MATVAEGLRERTSIPSVSLETQDYHSKYGGDSPILGWRPPIATKELWILGAVAIIGVLSTVHILVQSALSIKAHDAAWRQGCRQCRQAWWDDFWEWRLKQLEGLAANGTEPEPPPAGMEWEWGSAKSDTDWFGASATLVRSVIVPNVDPAVEEARLLHVGCGDSPMPQLMHDAGYHYVEHVDISPQVIQLMRSRYPSEDWPGIHFEVRDFMVNPLSGDDAPLSAQRFTAVVDKAGIWDWLQEEKPSALPILLDSVRDALTMAPEPGKYILTTKETPRELQQSLQQANSYFAVESTTPLSELAWAYVLVPESRPEP